MTDESGTAEPSLVDPSQALEIGRILYTTDFSGHAIAALPHARRFAEAFGAELHVLSVMVPYDGLESPPDELPGEREARRRLEGLEVDDGGEGDTTRVLERGIAAAPTILEYADDQAIDLIVMGSHGRRGLRRLLLGSVTEEVLRSAACPVLTVHRDEPAEGLRHYGKILVPVDFSRRTPLQVSIAADLARRFGSTIDLVHAVDPPIIPELYMPAAPLLMDAQKATEQASSRLAELASSLGSDYSVTHDVLIGGAVQEITRRAEEEEADLIVMPTHGYSGLDRLLMGSVAEGVLRRSSCPVLVIPARKDEGG